MTSSRFPSLRHDLWEIQDITGFWWIAIYCWVDTIDQSKIKRNLTVVEILLMLLIISRFLIDDKVHWYWFWSYNWSNAYSLLSNYFNQFIRFHLLLDHWVWPQWFFMSIKRCTFAFVKFSNDIEFSVNRWTYMMTYLWLFSTKCTWLKKIIIIVFFLKYSIISSLHIYNFITM